MNILQTVACLCGIAAVASQQPAFQDEVRPASGSGLAPQRRAGAGFQDSAWQAGRKLDQNADARGLYQEPFTLESDADMHAMIDLAYARMLERLKEQDKDHDGQLRMNNVPECVGPLVLCWGLLGSAMDRVLLCSSRVRVRVRPVGLPAD